MQLSKLITVPATIVWHLRKYSIRGILFSALILLAITWNFGSDYYTGKWLGFGIVFALAIGLAVRERFGAAAGAIVGYSLISTLWVLLDMHSRYATVVPYDLMALRFFSVEAALKLCLVVMAAMFIRMDHARMTLLGGMATCAFLFISLWQIFFEWLLHGCAQTNSCGGALGNPSLNAGMMVVCLPIAFRYFASPYRWILVAATAGGVILGRSNAGLGLLAAFLVLHLVSTKRWRMLSLLPVVAFCGWYFLGPKFMSSGDRLMMWEFFMGKWATNPGHWLFGTGYGTFGVFSQNLQKHFLVREGAWWIWMHNDWLQTIFEMGAIGFGLMVWLYTEALRGLWGKGLVHEAQSLVLFGLFMSMNFPIHVALPCAFLGWLLCVSLAKPDCRLHNGD